VGLDVSDDDDGIRASSAVDEDAYDDAYDDDAD